MMDLQVVVDTRAPNFDRIIHTLAHEGGQWSHFGNVARAVSGQEFLSAQRVACAAVGNELHVCLALDDGSFRHTIRHADGSWVNRFGNVYQAAGHPGTSPPYSFSCAGIGNELHLFALFQIPHSAIYYAVRHADGSWKHFDPILDLYPLGPIACTVVDGVLTVCMTAWQGTRPHLAVFTLRNGKPSAPVHVNVDGGLTTISELACAAVDRQLQIVVNGIANGKRVCWHTIRGTDGTSWQRYGDLAAVLGVTAENLTIAATSIKPNLEVFLATPGSIVHGIRRPDGTWAKDIVTAHAGGLPGNPVSIAAAAVAQAPATQPSPQPQSFASVRVHNGSDGDTYVVWSYDLASGQASNRGTIGVGQVLDVKLTSGRYTELFIVSKNAIDEHNRAFGTQLDPNDFTVAVTVNYEKATQIFLGSATGTFDWNIF